MENFIIVQVDYEYCNYINNNLPMTVYDRCCDFLLLEEKCLAYKNTKELISNK